MSDASGKAREIFGNALEIDSEAGRAAYLDTTCAGDVGLRQDVAALLAALGSAGEFMRRPAAELVLGADQATLAEAAGEVVGRYQLVEKLGEGGFGSVWVAEQREPVKRRVAVKIVKLGMDTRQVVARFEAERQALAMMDHPNIAQVLDAGSTDAGRPYFVMELVSGVPVTRFCDETGMAVKDRLGLFVQVCNAIQHAHQKGVIHRDIKPSNILVTLHDGAAVPRVIDFGIAKATGGDLTDNTVHTQSQQFVGTPAYVSPEQAQPSTPDVDTRSDIYSLGVLLYELLTGHTPFDARELVAGGIEAMRRAIAEKEPSRPSAKLAALHDRELTTTARQRATEGARLLHLLKGDLVWVVMKCLEKDRGRRYQTAGELAADVGRYLRNEPVQARPPSKRYRFRKFARRNKGVVVAGSAIATTVLLAIVSLAVSNGRTRDARGRAEEAQRLAETRAGELQGSLERLIAANALHELGQWYFNDRNWDNALESFTQASVLRPDSVTVWTDRGELYAQLGLFDLAGADFARAFALNKPETSLRWYRHALLSLYLGDTPTYFTVREEMWGRFYGTIGLAPELVRAQVLAPGQADKCPQMVAIIERGLRHETAEEKVHAGTLSVQRRSYLLYALGLAHLRAGQHEQAADRLRESLAAGEGLAAQSLSQPALAIAHYHCGRKVEARQALEAARTTHKEWSRQRRAGKEAHEWVISQGAGAYWPVPWSDWVEFQVIYREAERLIDGRDPPEDPNEHVVRGRGFAAVRKWAAAEAEYASALRLQPDDLQVQLEAYRSAGYRAADVQNWGEAAKAFTRATSLQPDDAGLWAFRAVAHFAAGDRDAYRQDCRDMVERFEKTADSWAAANVIYACVLTGDALPDMRRLAPLTRVAYPRFHAGEYLLGATLYRTGDYEGAVRCFSELATVLRLRAFDWSFLAMAHFRLGNVDEARRCLSEAARWIETESSNPRYDLAGTRTTWAGWHERITYPALLDEARRLVETGTPASQPVPTTLPTVSRP
jgi:tetratricopeptide (TPR) repeat protein/tRNA A-37 threonylcarbamoyl transferase component Bud32